MDVSVVRTLDKDARFSRFESCRGHSLFFEVNLCFERFVSTPQQSFNYLASRENLWKRLLGHLSRHLQS
jgi:hypothetical protein